MFRVQAAVLLAVLALSACSGPSPSVEPTPLPTRPPPPTATPPPPTATPVPEPTVDPLAQIVARQAELRTYRQALTIALSGVDRDRRSISADLHAEGESAGSNARLHVGTSMLGVPAGFQVVRADGRLYLNPLGFWVVADDAPGLPNAPLLPVPVPSNPGEMLALIAGGRFVPTVGVPVRGVLTDVLSFDLPPARAGELTTHLMIPQMVEQLFGAPTYTALRGEVAVGQGDGFVRRVGLWLDGYADDDPTRPFSIRATTELWDVNDPSIVVTAPTEPVVVLPSLSR